MGILSEARNCWRRPRAGRVALLVDAEHYFAALADAFERAQRSIVMVGWDFHSRVRLRRGEGIEDEKAELAALLEREVRRKRGLRVDILAWDYSMLYVREREWLPRVRFDLTRHRRVRLRLDADHPLGGSQHEKLVVVDGALAFCGGLDLTVCRWDAREHRPGDPRRNDPNNPDYGPFHDVQMAVDGDAARALTELVAERWERATGHTLRLRPTSSDPWPPGLSAHFRDVEVGIARTRPAFKGRAAVREVEQLFLDSVAAARECIFLENQYFTSRSVAEALAKRLDEEDGPEVVIVLPATLGGWLEESTMGVMMARVGRSLREADRHGRLRLLAPRLPEGAVLKVHSKVAVIDDTLLRVGSANLSNRSMGVDGECDLAIESRPERDVRREIRRFRDDLVAEHLGVEPEAVARATERAGSLRGAIDALAGGERTLTPRDLEAGEWLEATVPDGLIFDPERPVDFDTLGGFFSGIWGAAESRGHMAPALRIGLGVAAVLALVALWQWTPLSEWAEPGALTAALDPLEGDFLRWPLAVLGFGVATSLLVPVTALIAASGALFGFVEGALISLAGSLVGAGIGYAAGRLMWRDAVRRISGQRADRLARRLAERGVLSVAALRMVPVAPFGVVNLMIGSLHFQPRDYFAGTLLGMLPGTLALVFFGERALTALRNPDATTISIAVVALAAIAGVGALARRRFTTANGDREDGDSRG